MSSATNDGASESIRRELLRCAESGEAYEEALGLALARTRSPDRWLRVNALHCFGYIARVYGRLDLDAALPLLHEAQANTADPELAAAVQDALDDLTVFLPGFTA